MEFKKKESYCNPGFAPYVIHPGNMSGLLSQYKVEIDYTEEKARQRTRVHNNGREEAVDAIKKLIPMCDNSTSRDFFNAMVSKGNDVREEISANTVSIPKENNSV